MALATLNFDDQKPNKKKKENSSNSSSPDDGDFGPINVGDQKPEAGSSPSNGSSSQDGPNIVNRGLDYVRVAENAANNVFLHEGYHGYWQCCAGQAPVRQKPD